MSSVCQAGLVPRLVRDIDPASYAGSSSPRQFVSLNHGMAFTVFGGRELWMHDDREGGLFPVLRREEIRQLSNGFYAVRETSGGWTFWLTQGFPYYNVTSVSDERVGWLGAVYRDERLGPVVFEASRGSGRGLWTMSGEIARPLPLEDGALLRDWTPGDPRTFFIARHRTLGTALWVTDGTRAGTFPVVAPSPGRTIPLRLAGGLRGRLLLAVSGGEPELWWSDGTPHGLRPFTEIVHGRRAATVVEARVVDGRAFLVIDDGRHGRQLWTSDGTVAGTYAVTSFTPDPRRQIGVPLFAEEGIWYFVADDGVHGSELWRTDGTPQGTRLVVDVCPGPCSSEPRDLTREYFNSPVLVFTATGPEGLRALWMTDETPQGLSRLTPPGVAATTGLYFGEFFAAADASQGDELWSTEGSPETTHLWADLELIENGGSLPSPLAAAGDRLIFETSGPTVGYGLWSSDGTAAGTFRLPAPRGPQRGAVSLGERVVFLAPPRAAPTAPTALWSTDGTEAGLVRLTPPGVDGQSRLFRAGNRALFFAQDREHGAELWMSDGTPESTHLVADLAPGPASLDLDPYYETSVLRSQLLFRRVDDDRHLWVSDGTAAGTRRLVDADPLLAPLDERWGEPEPVAELAGKLFFVGAAPGEDGVRLWVSDGSPGGTAPLEVSIPGRIDRLFPAASHLFLAVSVAEPEPLGSTQLWVTDGTPAGTARVPTPQPELFDFVMRPVTFGDRFVFIDEDFRFWVTDGSAEGTFPLNGPDGQELFAWYGSVIAFGKYLVFSTGSSLGPSCFVWDGTGSTAQPIDNLECDYFLPVGERLYFRGFEPQTGAELWVFEER